MADIDDIKADAQKIWPDADHIDFTPGAAGHVSHTGMDPKGFRLTAIHKDGSIIGQVMADDLEQLDMKVKARLRGKAKL